MEGGGAARARGQPFEIRVPRRHAHELRTPLNAIIGFTELVHDGMAGPISETQKEYLGDVLWSARHLLQLIDDLLDLARVEAGKAAVRAAGGGRREGGKEVQEDLAALAEKKRIRCETELPPGLGEVMLDPRRFKQVIYNYLSNALRFTPEEGRVTVRVRAEGERHSD